MPKTLKPVPTAPAAAGSAAAVTSHHRRPSRSATAEGVGVDRQADPAERAGRSAACGSGGAGRGKGTHAGQPRIWIMRALAIASSASCILPHRW